MIGRAFKGISALLPFRYLRAAGVFVLAAWGLWTASRLFGRGAQSKRLGDAAVHAGAATAHHLDAVRAEAKARQVKAQAEKKIADLDARGHRTMAEQLKALNDL